MSQSKKSGQPLDLSFLTLPQYETELMGELWTPGGSGVASSDWHLPIVKEEIVRRLISDAKKHKATDWLIVAGDWFNFDVLSDYLPKQVDHTLMDEIKVSQRLMRILLGVFGVVLVGLGNHDVRLVRSLGYKMRFEHSMEICFGTLPESMRERILFTGRDYILHDSPEGVYRSCHTNNYSPNQLTIPSQIADIHQTHVLAAHRHHHALGFSKAGYRIGEMGGLMDGDRTAYLKRWTGSFPKWQNGYFIIDKNGDLRAPMLTAA